MSGIEIVALLNSVLTLARELGIEFRDLNKLFQRAQTEGRDITDEDLSALGVKADADLTRLRDAVSLKVRQKNPPPSVSE